MKWDFFLDVAAKFINSYASDNNKFSMIFFQYAVRTNLNDEITLRHARTTISIRSDTYGRKKER